MIFLGLILTSLSLWQMTLFNSDIAGWEIVSTGVIRGPGLGFIFVPLSTITFFTLAALGMTGCNIWRWGCNSAPETHTSRSIYLPVRFSIS